MRERSTVIIKGVASETTIIDAAATVFSVSVTGVGAIAVGQITFRINAVDFDFPVYALENTTTQLNFNASGVKVDAVKATLAGGTSKMLITYGP